MQPEAYDLAGLPQIDSALTAYSMPILAAPASRYFLVQRRRR